MSLCEDIATNVVEAGHRAPREVTVAPDGAPCVAGASDGTDTDEELLRRTGCGDAEAFAALHARMAGLVCVNVCRVLGDLPRSVAVTREVFVEVLRRAGDFDPDGASGLAWVLTLAHHRATDRVRGETAAVPSRMPLHDDGYGQAIGSTTSNGQLSAHPTWPGSAANGATGTIRVLLVDDEPSIRTLLRMMIDRDDADIVVVGEAGDGEAGLTRFAELRPDVVVLDQQMPGLFGTEVAGRILSMVPDQKILLCTAVPEEVEAECLRLNVPVLGKDQLASAPQVLRDLVGTSQASDDGISRLPMSSPM